MTTFLIGMDEAGYGPNLGPLVVAATVWQVNEAGSDRPDATNGRARTPIDLSCTDWYAGLADRISRKADVDRVAIADSKSLYSPAAGLALLEEGVLSFLHFCQSVPISWRNLVELLGADADGAGNRLPWHVSWDTPLPVAACPKRVEQLAQCLRQDSMASKPVHRRPQIRLHRIAASLVHPARFNRLTAESDSKATALSSVSLQLMGRVIERLPRTNNEEPLSAVAVCDKHGGRDHYAPLLVDAFSQTLIQVEQESRAISRYRLRIGSADFDISFKRKGESFLPTALASMTAKYVRELAMRAFNEFWCNRVAGLRPTAGYPVDASRFKRDIAAAQAELDIDDDVLWRRR